MHKNQHTLLTEVICLSENYGTHKTVTTLYAILPSL